MREYLVVDTKFNNETVARFNNMAWAVRFLKTAVGNTRNIRIHEYEDAILIGDYSLTEARRRTRKFCISGANTAERSHYHGKKFRTVYKHHVS